ncbi:MAG: putative Ig domain-containing protein, partial [Poseidonia sp.]
ISMLVGDTLYFGARDGSTGYELWAHDTSNHSTWQVIDLKSGTGDGYPGYSTGDAGETLVGDTLYFDAYDQTYRHELWAHDTSNHSTWRVADIYSGAGNSHPGQYMNGFVVGDTVYFSAEDGSGGTELWAHDTSNHSTWQITDINYGTGDSNPGEYLTIIVGDTIYFDASDGSYNHALWAHDTSNRSTWRVSNIAVSGHSYPETPRRGAGELLVGDTLYFSATDGVHEHEWWAHDTSNHSTWRVADINSGSGSSDPGNYLEGHLIGDTMYFSANDGSTGNELWAHRPFSIDYNTNTGGNVTTWAINNTNLPTGLTFSTSNGTIYGTPTQLWSKTAYMVWANNSGGSSVGYLNITVVDANLSYSKYDLTLTKDQASNDLPLNATTTAPGTVTTWAISSTLPAGLNFGTSNGTIWGIPTVLQTTPTVYTIWANSTQGSVSASITLTIYDNAPGPFEYNPENNTLTNNTYVHLEPDFINITTGNGSSWSTPAGTFMPWASSCLHHVYNGTLYTAATNGTGASPTFYGYGLDNETAWVINSSIFAPGCYKFIGYGGMTSWHGAFSMAYGTSLYFEAKEGTWDGLFGYGLENGTVWRESSNELEITSSFTAVFDDVLYFGAYHNSSVPSAMHAHNLSNGTTWLVLNASNGSPIQTYWTYAGGGRASVVGDVFFYYTYINSNFVYWAYNTSNGSAWAISSQVSSGGGPVLDGVFYYSSGSYYNLRQLYAYNVSNETSWQVHTRWGLNDIHEMDGVLYYGARSTTNSYTSLWAHNPDNGTTWEIGGTSQNNYFGFLDAGGTLFYRVHSGNSNERDLWAYEPSNTTAWQVTNIPLNGDTFTSLGNTVYFTSESTTISGEHDLWAYNTANETTWFVTNISTTNWGFTSSGSVHHPESTSLVFAGDTLYIREGGGMRSHQPASINYQTNTGGNVTTWAINASLPSGLSFSTTNGSIYGTPTELWTQTSYMVWANNSGGSSVAYLNITVVDEVPT